MSEQRPAKARKPKQKFNVTRTFVGKPEDAQRLVDFTLKLLKLGTEPQKKVKKGSKQ
jgi:hypothetical protein